ncbi:MAG: hypothetical protein PHF35_04700 [Candidatus Moranbacteria bacterium]|nr:hypothetical protein [Candidatus Moranbacteria bacterium]
MKKFILYFLLVLLIAALAILAYGFYNAKNVRIWAEAAAEIKSQHDISAKVADIEKFFEASGGKNTEELKNDMAGFQENLEKISAETEDAKKSIGSLGSPSLVSPEKEEIENLYIQSSGQIKNLSEISKFMSQLFRVASIFDRIKQDATLDDIRSIISEARSKSGEIDPDILPEDLRSAGSDLKSSIGNFLADLGDTAEGKNDGQDRLNGSYAEFSQKETDFFQGAKKYISSFRDLDALNKKIDGDLASLGRIRFSVK